MFEITLPYPPSVNHYYKRLKNRVILDSNAKKYRMKVISICRESGIPTFYFPINIDIEMYPPDTKKRDVDNILKGLLDGMQKGKLYKDDSLIQKLTIERFNCVKGGIVLVRMEERPDKSRKAQKSKRRQRTRNDGAAENDSGDYGKWLEP